MLRFRLWIANKLRSIDMWHRKEAAYELNRKSFGFEVDTKIYNNAISNMPCFQDNKK